MCLLFFPVHFKKAEIKYEQISFKLRNNILVVLFLRLVLVVVIPTFIHYIRTQHVYTYKRSRHTELDS